MLPVHDAHGKARHVVVARRVEAGHFRRLAAEERAARLDARVGHALHDLRHQFRRELAGGDVVQEEEGPRALYEHVIHAHGDAVLPDGAVDAHVDGQAQLRAYAVRAGDEHRFFHARHLVLQRVEAAETAQIAQDAFRIGRLDAVLDEFDFPLACVDVHAGFRVGQSFFLFAHAFLLISPWLPYLREAVLHTGRRSRRSTCPPRGGS